MIRKGQFELNGARAMSFADQFSAMAGVVRPSMRLAAPFSANFRF